jgi:hypothetical protein
MIVLRATEEVITMIETFHEPRIIKATHPHHPRAEIAERLLALVEEDPRLLLALAVNEARQPGYLGGLVVHAHLVAASMSEGESTVRPETVVAAVDAAIEWAGPKRVLSLPNAEPNLAAEHAMLDFVRAQFFFHCNTGLFDRRVFPRVQDEWRDRLVLDRPFNAAASPR